MLKRTCSINFWVSVKELICDKDSTTNATFCRYFPEGMITYCSNRSTKNSHKVLEEEKKEQV